MGYCIIKAETVEDLVEQVNALQGWTPLGAPLVVPYAPGRGIVLHIPTELQHEEWIHGELVQAMVKR